MIQKKSPQKKGSSTKNQSSVQPSSTTGANRVRLSHKNPAAKAVFVAGTFNHWRTDRTPMIHNGNGEWTIELDLAPGRHEYLFVVDQVWTIDILSRDYATNPFGGQNSVLVIG